MSGLQGNGAGIVNVPRIVLIRKEEKDLTPEEKRLAILCSVGEERERQDQEHGGPAHDDKHTINDWDEYLTHQLDRMMFDCGEPEKGLKMTAANEEQLKTIRERMIKVAALAVAVIESVDRMSAVNREVQA